MQHRAIAPLSLRLRAPRTSRARIRTAINHAIEALEPRRLLSAPPTPSNVTVDTGGRLHEATLMWNTTVTATSYNVYMDVDSSWVQLNADPITTTHFDATHLKEATEYTLGVEAVNGDGASSIEDAGVTTSTFTIVDDTGFNSHAALELAGLQRSYREHLPSYFEVNSISGKRDTSEAVDISHVEDLAATFADNALLDGPKQYIINFETTAGQESLPNYHINPTVTDAFIVKVIEIIDAIRDTWDDPAYSTIVSDLKIGAYNIPYGWDITGLPASYLTDLNNHLLHEPVMVNSAPRELADSLDYLTANGYSGSRDGFTDARSDRAWIDTVKSYGMAVFVYLRPYEDLADQAPINDSPEAAESPMDADYWSTIMDVSRGAADGVIVYTELNYDWNPDVPWWTVTEEYLDLTVGDVPEAPTPGRFTASPLSLSWENGTGGGDAAFTYIERKLSTDDDSHYAIAGVASGSARAWDDPNVVSGQDQNTDTMSFPHVADLLDYDYRIYSANRWGDSPKVEFDQAHNVVRSAYAPIVAKAVDDEDELTYTGDSIILNNAYDRWAGYWLDFGGGGGATNVKMTVSCPVANDAGIELYIDPEGDPSDPNFGISTPLDIFSSRETLHEATYTEQSWELSSPITGVHRVYLRAHNGDWGNDISRIQFATAEFVGPARPRELTASSMGDEVHLRWANFATDATTFRIERSVNGGESYDVVVDTLPGDAANPEYTDTSIAPNTEEAIYRVFAVRDSISSEPSNRDIATSINAGRNVQGEDYNPHQIDFNDSVGISMVERRPLRYQGVDFGDGTHRFTMSIDVWPGYVGNDVEIWIDGDGWDRRNLSYDDGGTHIGTLVTTKTNGWTDYNPQSTYIEMANGDPVEGVHDVYLKAFDATHMDWTYTVGHIDWLSTDPDDSIVEGDGTPTNIRIEPSGDFVYVWTDTLSEYAPDYVFAGNDPTPIRIEGGSGSVNVTIDAATVHPTGETLQFASGTYDITGDFAGASIDVTGATTVTADAPQTFSDILVRNSGTLNFNEDADLIRAISLDIGSASGLVDLADNDMIISTGLTSATPIETARDAVGAQFAAAWDYQTWSATHGLTSSTGAADTGNITTLGIVSGDDMINAFGSPYFFGPVELAAGDIVIKYTYYGDTDLSGVVDAADEERMSDGFYGELNGWVNGDFDYNGQVDGSDDSLFIFAFLTQGGQL